MYETARVERVGSVAETPRGALCTRPKAERLTSREALGEGGWCGRGMVRAKEVGVVSSRVTQWGEAGGMPERSRMYDGGLQAACGRGLYEGSVTFSYGSEGLSEEKRGVAVTPNM